MNLILPLMRREWLQHRFGWSLLAGVPLGLAVLMLAFAQIDISDDKLAMPAEALPVVLAFASIAVTTAVIFLTLWITSMIIVSGLPRRDHGDRSIEFWLSLPVGHAQSLAVPLLVHLILVPAAALLVGLAGGYVLSLVLVSRMVSLGAWFGLPWADILLATVALLLRLLAGLPLATLWMAPLILLTMLSTALFRRWGIVMLAVGLGLGSKVLEFAFGQPMLARFMGELFQNAGRALISGGGKYFAIESGSDPGDALQALPLWAWHDWVGALGALASPSLVGALVVAAACFAGLVYWRQRAGIGAGA